MAARRALEPRLLKVIELWRRSDHEGERHAAEQRGERLAAAAGLSFEQAVSAAEAAERHAAIVRRYGSEAAALAPCPREQKLRKSVAPWTCSADGRWTVSIDGSCRSDARFSPRVRKAIAEAYPLPTTVEQATDEYRYWKRRDAEFRVLRVAGGGLDLVTGIRSDIVRNMMMQHLDQRVMQRLTRQLERRRALECIEDALSVAKTAGRELDAWEVTHIGTALGHLLLERPDLVAGEIARLDRQPGSASTALPEGFEGYDRVSFERIVHRLSEHGATRGAERVLPTTTPAFIVSDQVPEAVAA